MEVLGEGGREGGFSMRRSARLISAGRPCINMCQSAGEADVERGKRARGERDASLEGARNNGAEKPATIPGCHRPPGSPCFCAGTCPRIVMGRWDGPLKGNIINQSRRPDIQPNPLEGR